MQGTGRDLTLSRAGLWPVFNSSKDKHETPNETPNEAHESRASKKDDGGFRLDLRGL